MRDNQFFRFLIVGGVAAALNVGTRLLLSQWLSYNLSIVLAFFVGLSSAFVLSRQFVYRTSTKSPAAQAFWFTLINLAALAQVWVVSVGLAEWLLPKIGLISELRYDLGHIAGVATPVITSYFAHKHITFGERDGETRKQ